MVHEGTVIDAPRYAQALRELGVSSADVHALRIKLADVAGTRRGVLHVAGGKPSLALRPLAQAPQEITVNALPIRDERKAPERVGPDSGWQQTTLAALSTNEGLLADESGRVVSAVMHPLLAITPGRVAVSTHPHTPETVTVASVADMLRGWGIPVVEEPHGFNLNRLTQSEVWVIDPVYGARLVETWVEYGTPRPATVLFERGGVPSHREVNDARREQATTL